MSNIYKTSTGGSGPLPPTVATQYTENTGTAIPAANNLNVLGSVGIETTGSTDTIAINVVRNGFDWEERSVDTAIFPQEAFICTAALTVSLPATAGLELGDSVFIYVDTASAVVIDANTGQFIQVGNQTSTAGGTATSSALGSMMQLFFRPNDLTWHAIAPQGTWTTA